MTGVEERKLAMYKVHLGVMTADQALDVAIEHERIASMGGPFDPATARFLKEQQSFETYAALLEKEQTNG